MRPLTHSLPKAMLPVAGKPSIFHIIDKVMSAGVQNFVIITGYLREKMEAEITKTYPELNIDFMEQKEQKGLGHACWLGREKIGDEDQLLIIYGDTLFEADLKPILKQDIPHIGVSPVEDPSSFGIVETEEGGYIQNFVEKPDKPLSNLAIPGVNFFPRAGDLFDGIDYIIKNDMKTKNEYQVTDAFFYMLSQKNIQMKCFNIDQWYDCGTLDSILDTNKKILQKNKTFAPDQITGSEIIHPVYVAADAKISISRIGPNVSIASGVSLENSQVSNSIIDQNSCLKNCNLKDSLIGRNTFLEGANGKLMLGNDATLLL